MTMSIDNRTIEQLYDDLGEDLTVNTQLYETIIETKHNNTQLIDVNQSLYSDIKGWCYNYISSKHEKDYGYDVYERKKIVEKINDKHLSNGQKLSLILYIRWILSRFNDDGAWLDKKSMEYKLAILKKENKLKYLLVLSASSKWRCIKTILLFFFIELVVLMPAPFKWMEVFRLQTVNYSDYEWLNHIVNVLALRINWIEGPTLVCQNWCGVLMCGLWMLVYIVFVVNILFNNIFSKISEYDE